MDIRGRWIPFKATWIYAASPLSFNWRARLQMLLGLMSLEEMWELESVISNKSWRFYQDSQDGFTEIIILLNSPL